MQTRVIQEQLSAQVWPYVAVAENIGGDTVQISVANDGLGPAVIWSATITLNGQRRRDFIDVMHALLGPNLVGRLPRREKISLSLNSSAPGSVLRPGDSTVVFALKSKSYAAPFLRGTFGRLKTSICYCAIVPNTCWLNDSSSSVPQPRPRCAEVPDDLLHSSPIDALTNARTY